MKKLVLSFLNSKSILLILLTISISKINAQWTTTLYPSAHTNKQVEIGVNPHFPDAWLNTYADNCMQFTPDMPGYIFPNTNHIRMVQKGKIENEQIMIGQNEFDDEAMSPYNGDELNVNIFGPTTYNCDIETEFIYKTHLSGPSLILQGRETTSSGTVKHKYVTYRGTSILLHQNTNVLATLTASNAIITNLNVSGNFSFNNLTTSGTVTAGGITSNGDLDVKGILRVKNSSGTNVFRVDQDGFVRAREVQVDLQSIPDYVFDRDYKLMSLEETNNYIQKEHHLPNIKSKKEYEQEGGVGIGELNLKLLEKIEELTLHVINQQKEIAKQGKQALIQQLEIEKLKTKLKIKNH